MPQKNLIFAIIGLGVILLGVSGLILFFQEMTPAKISLPDDQIKPHYANDAAVDISRISIGAVYFVPRDLEKSSHPDWQIMLKNALTELKRFYEFQSHNAISISYEIFPQPIAGREDHLFYDGSDTSRGNTQALISARKEIKDRLLAEGGDRYLASFSGFVNGAFGVVAIMYEGVGASAIILKDGENLDLTSDVIKLENGGPPAFLISRSFLFDPAYKDYGLTFFAHEFSHTLGLMDGFDQITNQPFSNDLMGAGRFRPLTATYLSKENKNKLGIPY